MNIDKVFGVLLVLVSMVGGYMCFYITSNDFTSIHGVIGGDYKPVSSGITLVIGGLFAILSAISFIFGIDLIADKTGVKE